MTRHEARLILLAALGILLVVGCGGQPIDDGGGFSGGVGGDDDDDDDDDTPGPDDRGAYVEFSRTNVFGETSATSAVTSSWYNATPTEVRVPIPDDLDACWSGENITGFYSIPATQHDVGTPSIQLLDGSSLEMSLDAELGSWGAEASTSDWESQQEYGIAISGGEDREAASYPGALGTPAALQLVDMQFTEDGVLLDWYGGNDNAHVELRLIQISQPDGEEEMIETWTSCRLLDDGQHLIPFEDLLTQNDGPSELEMLRSTSTNFTLDEDTQGMAMGTSIVTATYTPPDSGEEED